MKAYFIGSGFMGCWYARCYTPMIANGWKGMYHGLSEKSIKPANQVMKEILDSDVIVFHRANTNWHHRVGMIAKEQGKKIVFDNDDTFQLDESSPFLNLDEKGFYQNKEKLNNVVNNFILNSDLITTSTPLLAEEYKKINKNTIVLPNYVNPEDWPDVPQRNEGDKVRIGIVGSTAYQADFFGIKDLIKKLTKDPRVQVVLFGLHSKQHRKDNPLINKIHWKEYAFWDSLENVEFVPFCKMENYFFQLDELKLDLMMIPRRHNYFNQCKSNIKFLEASMLEIPVIAEGFDGGPYQELDGKNGLLATNDWEEKVEMMIKDKDLRRQIGRNAKEYVLKNYNIADHSHKWLDAYSKL